MHVSTPAMIRFPPHTPFLYPRTLPSSHALPPPSASPFQHTSSLLPPVYQDILFEPLYFFCFTFSNIISVSYRQSYFLKKVIIFIISRNILTWSFIKDRYLEPFIQNSQQMWLFWPSTASFLQIFKRTIIHWTPVGQHIQTSQKSFSFAETAADLRRLLWGKSIITLVNCQSGISFSEQQNELIYFTCSNCSLLERNMSPRLFAQGPSLPNRTWWWSNPAVGSEGPSA